jgi:putative FmdB family regulatory protein
MPVYDYRCTCGNTRTQTLSITTTQFIAVCHCGLTMTRVYTAPAVTFKGNGWGKDKN